MQKSRGGVQLPFAQFARHTSRNCLKGVWHQILDFRFFHESVSLGPEYTAGAISNFYENSRRCSKVKVYHRC
jgi:hypothetical protein